MKQVDVLILSWHQTYLSSYAGGYVRLKEFLKRFSNLNYLILDNYPSIYKKEAKDNLIQYQSLKIIKPLLNKLFILWFLLEIISVGFILYKRAKKIVEENGIKVIYVPIGEFRHLYLPAYFLKKKFPQLKVVVDILNFEYPEKTLYLFYKKLRKNNFGIIRSLATAFDFSTHQFIISKTINFADYVFTVSPQLIKVLKKHYHKKTIDFTPSGVDNSLLLDFSIRKKYLGVYLGRMNMEKGIIDVINVWKKVVEIIPEAKLALAGVINNDFKNIVTNLIQQYNLEDNIDTYYSVSEKKKKQILSESQIFLHLAKYEPLFPVIGILEGFSCGLPAIVYDMLVVSSQQNALKKWKCLYIIENSDINQVVKKINEYYKIPQQLKKNLSNEAKKIAGLYDWDTITKKEYEILFNFN